MLLTENPFFIIGAQKADGISVIMEKAQVAIEKSKESDEVKIIQAQNDLTAPAKRIKAEVNWFPELTEESIADICKSIVFEKRIGIPDSIRGISKANIYTEIVNQEKGNKKIIENIFKAQTEYSVDTILNLVNQSRKQAKIKEASEEKTAEVIKGCREAHANAIIKYLESSEHPGTELTGLVEEYIENNQMHDFLDIVEEKYSISISGIASQYEREIREQVDIANSAKKEDCEAIIDKIIYLLKEWDEYQQPIQLIKERKGLDDKISKDLCEDVTRLGISLANDKGLHSLSLKLNKSLQEVFPELPNTIGMLQDGQKQLEEIIKNSQKSKDIMKLINAVEKAESSVSSFCEWIDEDKFNLINDGLHGEIWRAFTEALKNTKNTKEEKFPWMILRGFAIKLHNNHQETKAAKIIIDKLIATGPPMDIRMQMLKDAEILRQNYDISLQRSGNGGLNIPGSIVGFVVLAFILALCTQS